MNRGRKIVADVDIFSESITPAFRFLYVQRELETPGCLFRPLGYDSARKAVSTSRGSRN